MSLKKFSSPTKYPQFFDGQNISILISKIMTNPYFNLKSTTWEMGVLTYCRVENSGIAIIEKSGKVPQSLG